MAIPFEFNYYSPFFKAHFRGISCLHTVWRSRRAVSTIESWESLLLARPTWKIGILFELRPWNWLCNENRRWQSGHSHPRKSESWSRQVHPSYRIALIRYRAGRAPIAAIDTYRKVSEAGIFVLGNLSVSKRTRFGGRSLLGRLLLGLE